MSAKAIREATGKELINKHLQSTTAAKCQFVTINADTNIEALPSQHPWLTTQV